MIRKTRVYAALYFVSIICAICGECRSIQKEYNAENETTNDKNSTVLGPICETSEGIKFGQNDIIFSSPGHCIGVECDKNGEIVYLKCRPAKVKRGCHGRYFDFTKPFPECCPAAVC